MDCLLCHSLGLGINTWSCVQHQSFCPEWQPEAWGLRCSCVLHGRGKYSEHPTDCVPGWRRHQLEDVHGHHCEGPCWSKGRYQTHRKEQMSYLHFSWFIKREDFKGNAVDSLCDYLHFLWTCPSCKNRMLGNQRFKYSLFLCTKEFHYRPKAIATT